ncbi:MobA/MobL family protein, partial [Chelatococcus asaccharovorans]
IADIAIHRPDHDSDDRNHHAHVMLTMRELTAGGFHSSKATPTARSWNDKELLQTWREEWASQQNRILEREGHAARVDHRSLEAQGFDREPQAHLGPSAHGMEQRGERSRIGDENRAKDAANQNRAEQHRREAVINLAIERHRRQHAEQSALRVHALQDAQRLDLIDLERRHHRQALIQAAALEKQYGAAQRTMSAELAAVQARSQTTGWRGLLRKVTGAEKRDQQQAARLSATLGSIEQRKAEAVGTLRNQQAEERRAVQAKQTAQENQLKAELAKQGAARERAILGEAPTRAALQARAAVERQQAQQPTAAPKRPDRSEQWRNRYRKPKESTGRARDRQEIEQQAARPDAATVQARAAVERQQAQQPTERAASITARQVEPWRVKVPARAVKLDARQIEKQAQEKPAPNVEQEAMKHDFDKARIRPQEPRRAPTAPEFVARPAPAPSPSGEVPRPAQRIVQDVPAPAPRRQETPAPAPAKKDWRQATNQQPRAPQPPRDWSAPAERQQAPAPAARKDWDRPQEKPAPQQASKASEPAPRKDWGAAAPRKDWSAPATDRPREIKSLPPRGLAKDRDRDR